MSGPAQPEHPASAGPPNLGFAIGLPPRDAIAYLQSQGVVVSNSWKDLWQEARARAFTVAGVTRLDVLEDIHSALVQSLKMGRDKAWYHEHLQNTLQKKGWWGKGRMTARRLEFIWQQNVQDAYMAGRYRAQLANSAHRPYWQYSAKIDARTRPHHKALHNKVFRFDDVFWKTHYPPNGFRCRCRVRALSQYRFEKEGLALSFGEGRMVTDMVEMTSRKTGEVYTLPITGYQEAPGKAIHWADRGFAVNTGSVAFGTDASLAQKLALVRDPALYAEVVQSINNSPLRHAAFATQVEGILRTRHSGVSVLTVGFTEQAVVAFAEARGLEPSRIMLMSDKQLLHADSDKHRRDGIALTEDELKRLPALLTQAETVLWDTTQNNVTYVVSCADPEQVILIAVDTPAQGKRKKMTSGFDSLVNIYKVPRKSLQNRGRYEMIR